MSARGISAIRAPLRIGLLAASSVYLLVYVFLALWRMRHPFELEWMEGAMVDHVRRIVEGQQIYVRPSIEFVPFIYPPAFYYVSAAVARVAGADFFALRLVSFLSSLGVFGLLYRFVERETRDRFAALCATGLFAATYQIGGAFFDVGRVDSLFLFVLLGALYILRFHDSLAAHAASGALIGLAFLTKQSAVVMAAPALLYAVHRRPRRGLVAGGVAGALMIGSTLLLDGVHDGWYRFYTLEIPSGYPMLRHRLVDFWRVDLLPLAIAWVVGLLYIVAPGDRSRKLFYAAVAAGLVGGSWLSRGNPGGYYNVLIPAYLAACLLFGLGLHTARATLSRLDADAGARGEAWLGLAALLQFALLVYNPMHAVPSRSDTAAGHALLRTVAGAEGDVWIPYHGSLTAQAGKPSFAHWMAISDILESRRDSLRIGMQREIDEALRERRFGLIVQSTRPFGNMPDLTAFYVTRGAAIEDRDAFWPVVGTERRTETLFMPERGEAGGRTEDL